MVYEEALRKYAMPGIQLRQSVKKYTFKDLNLSIDKGVGIVIPNLHIHNDPHYFPDPDKFDPERFSPDNKAKIKKFTYMPFGAGPRNCIGKVFYVYERTTTLRPPAHWITSGGR